MDDPKLFCATCADDATQWDGTAGDAGLRCDEHAGTGSHPLNEYDRYLWAYKLIVRAEALEACAYTLAPARRDISERAQTTEIAVVRGHVLIFGDWCPSAGKGRNQGVIYGPRSDALAWFAGRCGGSGHYLAGKFLEEVWSDDLALEWLRSQAKDDPERADRWAELIEDAEWRAGDGEEFQQWFANQDEGLISSDDYSVGFGHVPRSVDHLAAIQRRFRVLWWATREAAGAPEAAP